MAKRNKKKYMFTKTIAFDGTEFSVDDCIRFMRKHMRLRDLLSLRSIVDCYENTFYYFLKHQTITCQRKNWKFYDDDVTYTWIDEPNK